VAVLRIIRSSRSANWFWIENYFAEVEQAAFDPSNIVPGMGDPPDNAVFLPSDRVANRIEPRPQDRSAR